ncbi:MAG TPA: alpha/beta hydrolase, partial [Nitrospiria bacterium]|nr:alpha/beta hydrolase [Nitrospiria bacterium]
TKEIKPEGPVRGCVIALHGRGVRGSDLAPLAGAIGMPDVRWVFPDGPMEVPPLADGRAWYDSSDPNHEGLNASREIIFGHIERLEKEGLPPERILLAGFSQGAVVSLDAGLRYPRRLAGLIGMSGYLAHPDRLEEEMSPAASALPVLLTHGKNDEVLSVEGSREAQAVLKTLGFSVELREYLMGHEVIQEVLEEVRKFMVRVFD